MARYRIATHLNHPHFFHSANGEAGVVFVDDAEISQKFIVKGLLKLWCRNEIMLCSFNYKGMQETNWLLVDVQCSLTADKMHIFADLQWIQLLILHIAFQPVCFCLLSYNICCQVTKCINQCQVRHCMSRLPIHPDWHDIKFRKWPVLSVNAGCRDNGFCTCWSH